MGKPVKPEILEDLESLAHESISSLRKFLAQSEHTSLDIGKARVAASAFSGWTRYRQSESANETNALVLARELAADKNEFRRFVRLGLPNAPILKALPPGDGDIEPARKRRAS